MFRNITGVLALLFLLLCSSAAFAQEQQFGNWAVMSDPGENVYAALTESDGGDVLGQFCHPAINACMWLLTLNRACNHGERTKVVAHSDKEAANLELLCGGPIEGGPYGYGFTDPQAVDKLVKAGTRISFSVPAESGQSNAVSFDLEGAKPAIDAMTAAAQTQTGRGQPGAGGAFKK